MDLWSYLLMPLYPPIAMICLLVFAYERLAQNQQERVGDKFTATRALFMLWNGICLIVGFPAVLLGPCGGLIRWPVVIIFSPILLLWGLLRHLVWRPLFGIFVPKQYGVWNSKVYENVPVGKGQIRILEVQPGTRSANLEIRLKPIDLEIEANQGGYEALSYSWGGHLILRRVININGRSYFVADTVSNALKELRLPDRVRRLWIDAICIDQGNTGEKSKQVALMGAIYRTAQSTIVWLGKPSGKLGNAFEFIQKVSSAPVHQVAKICDNKEEWQPPIDQLMRVRWWSRVWIVQEVALARNVVVRCGNTEISWDTMTICFQRLSSLPHLKLNAKVLTFLDTITRLQHSDEAIDTSLYGLALRFRDRIASDPRDKLLGYTGLARDTGTPHLPEKPYSETAPELFAHFAASIINSTGSLAMVALAEDYATHKSTWVLDWEKMTSPEWRTYDPIAMVNKPKRQQPILFWSHDSLPSISGLIGKEFSAAGDTHSIIKQAHSTWDSILLKGWEEDSIERVSEPFEDIRHATDVMRNWLEQISKVNPNKSKNLIQTLVAGAWQGTLSSNWTARFQQYLLSPLTQSQHSSRDIAMQGNGSTDPVDQMFEGAKGPINVFALIYACCFRRRFFITKKGRFGLGPVKTLVGYKVYVMPGSRVPFILAPPFMGQDHHVIGQAYVDGVMQYEGDLEADLREGKKVMEEILIN